MFKRVDTLAAAVSCKLRALSDRRDKSWPVRDVGQVAALRRRNGGNAEENKLAFAYGISGAKGALLTETPLGSLIYGTLWDHWVELVDGLDLRLRS